MKFENYNFTEFKEKFYGRIKDTSLFEENGINYLKVVLECLMVKYSLKWEARPYPLEMAPSLFIALKRKYYQFRKRHTVEAFKKAEHELRGRKTELVLVDNGRKLTDSSGKTISTYYHLLRAFLTEKKISFFHYNSRSAIKAYKDEYDDLFFRSYIATLPLSLQEKKELNSLRRVFGRLKTSGLYDEEELSHMKTGMTFFFETYRVWNWYLNALKPSKLILLGHYQQEGLILACRRNGVHVIELQHGLIAREDIFYVMPALFEKIRSKALFADCMYTFGSYWSDLLKEGYEYGKEQIKELGYYLYEDVNCTAAEETLLKNFTQNKKVVLITNQPGLSLEFIEYIKKWREQADAGDCVFILKLHPADKDEVFVPLHNLSNVLVTRIRLEVLFRFCHFHVTCYSTTIFDALRYNVKNYTVNFEVCSDYVESIVNNGFAEKVNVDEFPPLNGSEIAEVEDVERFYEKHDFSRLQLTD